jgi:hypothetical protein
MKRAEKPKVGSKFRLWNTERIVLEVRKYNGLYINYFTWIVRVNLHDGKWIETVI